jgi:hypothetical protein
MRRSTFLSLAAVVAFAVGAFALFAPAVLLATKGVSSAAADVWAREVGVLLIAIGVCNFLVRNHEDSPTLRAFLIGNTVVQIGLFPVELLAYRDGTITLFSGIVPNSIIHILLAAGFIYYIAKMKPANKGSSPKQSD